jgi:hypothetical protein
MTADSDSTLKVAHQAFEHLQHGLATAEWTPMLEMLTEDFSFGFPVGPYHGVKYRSSSLRDK